MMGDVSYEDKALSTPPERQPRWYRVCSHVLLLNVSEQCRRTAAAQADRECAGVTAGH